MHLLILRYKYIIMKKTIAITIVLAALGNLIIMLLENVLFLKADILALQNNLMSAKVGTNVNSLYEAIVLYKKMGIWLFTFALLSTFLYFVKVANKQMITYILVGFYTIGCMANVLVVPHPIWFVATTVVVVIAPFVLVPQIIHSIKHLIALTKSNYYGNKNYTTNLG